MTRPNLRAVPDTPEQPIDIYAADKARIAAIDWSAVHISGDHRSRIVDLPDRPRRSGLERRR